MADWGHPLRPLYSICFVGDIWFLGLTDGLPRCDTDRQPLGCCPKFSGTDLDLPDRGCHSIREWAGISHHMNVSLGVYGDERTIALAPEDPDIQRVFA